MALRILGMLALALALQVPAGGPPGIRNGGFEEGEAGGVPAGWVVPAGSGSAGYRVSLSSELPKSGARAALLVRDLEAKEPGFGNLMQTLDAAPFRERRVTLRASVRTAPGSRAQLWMRVDRAGGRRGFFDNMADRPIVSSSWRDYRIEGDVHGDAVTINVGLMLLGEGKAWLDDVSVESAPLAVRPAAPARALEGRGLDNVVAFSRLLGYVRYFHPSDQAAGADWDVLAIEAIAAVEGARSPDALARMLEERFRPFAPTVRVFAGAPPPLPAELKPTAAGRRVVMWRHHGVGLRGPTPGNVYASERWTADLVGGRLPSGMANPAEPLVVDLGGGVKAAVPLALWNDGAGTLPRRDVPAPAPRFLITAADRATRLAAVALAWNVFQHFYPYFDVVEADWPASLRRALTAAAIDDEASFGTTLRALVADLHDGHGRVMGVALDSPPAYLPLAWDWIEGHLVVTAVAPGQPGIRPGDTIAAIDGKPTTAVITATERLISAATPQWRRYRALGEMLGGPAGEAVLTISAGGASRDLRVARIGAPVSEKRPDAIAEVRPGILYVDPARLSDAEFNAALPRLSRAAGIVFEMRGYPRLSPAFLQHLIGATVQSAQWLIPLVTRPDREALTFEEGGRWTLLPLPPRLTAPIAFVTDGRAISYAESCMGIVEHYKLGAIVGGPTAGTNGNVNPFQLPGGYTIAWTGMKVLKHDGSRHHGVGIQPTIPVSRTTAGVREGRDEFLERAIEAVRR